MTTTITADYKNQFIAAQVVEREHEIFHYQLNIDNYTHMLANLPDSDFKTHISELIQTEQAEQAKSQAVYNALLSQLPADQVNALIQNAATVRSAKTNG